MRTNNSKRVNRHGWVLSEKARGGRYAPATRCGELRTFCMPAVGYGFHSQPRPNQYRA
jgi:hypothetical protein